MGVGTLESTLRERVADGHKCLVPYITAGLPQDGDTDWTTILGAIGSAGADAIEVGIPFSDPVMDGPIIQQASQEALDAGATPAGILRDLALAEPGVPTAVMTYANLVYRFGWQRFASELKRSGVAGAILPDIPLEEAGLWCAAADEAGVETVMLAAPTADDARLGLVIERARGFVYAVGLLGVTGERAELAATAKVIAARIKALTDMPVLVGVGIGTPQQAADVCEVADGVVVGSAVVRRAIETRSPEAVGDLVVEFSEVLARG